MESIIGTPAAAAARTVPLSPSGCRSACPAEAAIATGIAAGRPRNVVAADTSLTSTSTRGRSVLRRQAASFSARLSSSHAPPAT